MQNDPGVSGASSMTEYLVRLERRIYAAAELLPRQGPITKFAFLNPLQGLEHEHFDAVMAKVLDLYGNQPYLDDDRYRQMLWRGRITDKDLRAVLAEDLGTRANETVGGLTPRIEARLAMLVHPLPFGHRRELDWVLSESEALWRFRPEVTAAQQDRAIDDNRHWVLADRHPRAVSILNAQLGSATDSAIRTMKRSDWEAVYLRLTWQLIESGVQDVMDAGNPDIPGGHPAAARHSRGLPSASSPEVDELLIRFTSAFLDQGYASRGLPGVERGYLAAFFLLYAKRSWVTPRWRRSLAAEINRISEAGWSSLELVDRSLRRLGVSDTDTDTFIRSTLLALRGFSGMIWQSETRADLFTKPSPRGTLVEYLAIRLLLLAIFHEQHSASSSIDRTGVAARQMGGDASGESATLATPRQMAFLLFELAQVLLWQPKAIAEVTPTQWREWVEEMRSFSDHHRRRIFHAAFERQLARMAMRAVSVRAGAGPMVPKTNSLQIVCCIDAREESLRRHLEEIEPTVETFGMAGFFGVPMYYRGAGDAGFSALCPIVIKPAHWVIEEAVYSLEESQRTRAQVRRWIGSAQRGFQTQSRGSLGGAVLSTLFGPLATIPMLSRILMPRLTANLNHTARQFVAPPAVTRLRLEREADQPAGPEDERFGFTLDEMIEIAKRALEDIGLTKSFAPLVILLGHGSSCVNNPHESAYHCGACAGNAGGPNARALAGMLNDPRVRRRLIADNLVIPEETHFMGAMHNTATEEMMFYDLELLPTRKRKQIRAARDLLSEAAKRNAHERCRRFDSAALDLTPDQALLHVQNRSEDLAQTRPEYGNGSNAICFVGRRARIRGLFLDRRAFLMSYDPTADRGEREILARILAAVVPVCQGINSLYTLSAIDPGGWGSGTKLPHNVTSLIGVMDGAASDLRPGLPWQGVDIHEPVRLLFIIETTPDAMRKVMSNHPLIARIIRNHWAHLATLDPESGKIHRFSKDDFIPLELEESLPDSSWELPVAIDSIHWYGGRRDHLPFALLRPVGRTAVVAS